MLWLVVIFCGLLLLIMILGIFFFIIRRQTIIRIFLNDGTIFTKRFFLKAIPEKLITKFGIYFVDKQYFYKTFFGYVIHYTYNNPNPIRIIPKENEPSVISHRASNMLAFYQDRSIEQMFNPSNVENIILYLVIGCLLLSGVILAFNIMQPSIKSCNIVENANNTKVIANAVRMAITTKAVGVPV